MNIRHGDILLTSSKKEKGEIIKHNGSFILAEGETTGHKHVLTVPKIDDMEVIKLDNGAILLTLRVAGTLTHQEHKTLNVPAGTYVVGSEKEKDWFSLAVRKVQD